jgi:hypothetical protein
MAIVGGDKGKPPIPEPDWHKGCSWCWRTIWHQDEPETQPETETKETK